MTISNLDLVYFADPMCSWCYGFGPELEKATREDFALTQRVGVNGFPTLCVDGGEGKLLLINAGLAQAELVIEGLARQAAAAPPLH